MFTALDRLKFLAGGAAFALTGCGGGSSGGNSTPTPTPVSVTPTPSPAAFQPTVGQFRDNFSGKFDIGAAIWWDASGGNADYIDWAFEAARAADPDCKLFINDYNSELSGKRASYVEVITDLVSRGIPLDGVGHQMHLHYQTQLADALAALDAIDDNFLGLDQHVTELDVSLYNDPGSCYNTGTNCDADFGGNVPDSIITQQAELYRGLFQ